MKKAFFLLPLLLILACKTNKPAAVTEQAKGPSCKTTATIIDMTNLDGCRFLLKVKNGEKWLPLKMPEGGFKFHKDQVVRFDYEEVDDYISICMAENKGVNISCIEEVSSAQDTPPACVDSPKLLEIDWMAKLINQQKIKRIIQYQQEGTYLYCFKTNTKSYLYNCKGILLCDINTGDTNDCSKRFEALTDGKVLWVTNN